MPGLDASPSASRLRILGVGWPKAGKTGSLAALVNAGYNLRMMDFDGHAAQTLAPYVKPERRAFPAVSVITLEDQRTLTAGKPTIKKADAYVRACNLLDNWQDGAESLGPVASWGPKDLLVVDPLTELGNAAQAHWQALNSSAKDLRRIIGGAQELTMGFLDAITSSALPCHLIVFAHLALIGPDAPDIDAKSVEGSSNTAELAKLKIEEAATHADMVPPKLYPKAPGKAISPHLGGKFPIQLIYDVSVVANIPRRRIFTVPRSTIDAGVPAQDLPSELPQESGLLTIFEKVAGKLKP